MQLLYFTGLMALTCMHAMYLNASISMNTSTSKQLLNARAPEFRPAKFLELPIGTAGAVTMAEQKVVSPPQRNQKRPLTAMSQKLEFTDLGPHDYERNKSSAYQKILAMKLGSSTHNRSIDVQNKAFLPFDKEQEDVLCRQHFKKYFDSLSCDDKQSVMAAINAGKPVEYAMDVSRAHVKKNKSGEEYTTYTHTPFSALIQFPRPQVQIKNIDQLTDFLQKDAAEILDSLKALKRSKALQQTVNSKDAIEEHEAFVKTRYGDSIGKSQNPYAIAMDNLLFTPRKRIVTQAIVMQSDALKNDIASVSLKDQIKEDKRIERQKKRAEFRQKQKTMKEHEKQLKILPILQTTGAVDHDYTSSQMGGADFTSDQIDEILVGSSRAQDSVITTSVTDITEHISMIGIDDISSIISPIDDLSTQKAVKGSKKKTKNDGKKAADAQQDKFLDELLSSPEYEEGRKQRVERLIADYESALNKVLSPKNYGCIKQKEHPKNNLLKELEKLVQAIFVCNKELQAIGYCFSKYVSFDKYIMIQNKGYEISTVFNWSRNSGIQTKDTQVISDAWRKIESLHIPGNILHGVDKTAENRAVQQSQFKFLKKMRTDLGQPTRIPNSMPKDQALAIFKNDLKCLLSDHDDEITWYEVMGQKLRHRFEEGKINSDVFHVDIAQYIQAKEIFIDSDKKTLLIAILVDFIIRE